MSRVSKVIEDILESVKNNESIEILVYILYVYYLLLLAIWFAPSKGSVIVILLFVIICSINICTEKNCKRTNKYMKIAGILLYALFCIAMHSIIHTIYVKNKRLRGLLLLLPLVYLLVVKFLLYVFGCDKFSNYNYMIDLLKYVVGKF